MQRLVEFSIPLSGIKNGRHEYKFQVGSEFFSHFKDSPVKNGDLEVLVELDKRIDMLVVDFEIDGRVSTECDRCLASIGLPISGNYQLLVKFDESEKSEDVDFITISPDTQSFDLAPFAYEFIVLSIPMIKVYDCEDDDPRPCDDDMLDKLDEAEDLGDDTPPENPIWDELRKLTSK